MEQEIRAVVLGWQKSDKASVINSILGDKVEPNKYFVKSVRKDGEVNGRKISLINTPCWWENYDLQDSPEAVKQELVCSVFLCEPGPHVFLLVINQSLPFTEENRLTIEKHLSLFGEKIWRHTIVLLTQRDSARSSDLQRIIQRCGERYHVFDFENKSAGGKDLLDKIDDVVAANNAKHFETHDDMLLDIQRKRDENERRAKARQEKVQEKGDLLKEINAVAPLSELRIVLLGWIMSGKSSTVNTIFNHEIFPIRRTQKCTSYTGVVNGRSVTVLDTPGWWKYFSCKVNPENARASILKSVGQSRHMQFPHAMILVVPIDTSFKNEQKRIITEYMVTFGDYVWRHTVVLFTWGDRFPDISIEQHIESEGDALQWLIQKCRNRYHVFDNTNKNNRDQVTELLQKIDEMVAENSLFSLNPQCAAEEYIHDADTQQDEDISLDDDRVLNLLQQELNNRFKEIKRKLKHLGMDFTECTETRSRRSISDPPSFSAEEKVKEKMRREGSRWEATLMDTFLNNQNPESSPDLREKVLVWLQRCDEYSSTGYGTSSNISSLEDLEPKDKT
ncbi:GTPase IMAP family member 8 isoform X2 [Carassius gibelio]|uniref:GTPase IMAP family member 8 isoform X2 n=1 Tax=Carassius gibelio TaxID=101364 RepID=UPI0022796538|nr:GTPase IMAP family member 8 isoform X2 [Carassius gibelio]